MQYKMMIELLSDTCPASGAVYNSAVDTEVEYDRYGLPFISGKRIKGCLRESALQLFDWGKKVPIEELFGSKGSQSGCLVIDNARVPEYERCCKELEEEEDAKLTHPMNVLGLFTSLRYQTSLEHGIAKQEALRCQRVLKKGNCFESMVSFPEAYYDTMNDICKITRHMGMNRTRGMGEIAIRLEPVEEEQEKKKPIHYEEIRKTDLEDERTYRLSFHLKLQEPVIVKSIDKGQENTKDYLEGSKILGMIAGWLGKEEYRKIMEDEPVCCSNLYLSEGKNRGIPVPVSYRKVKDSADQKIYDYASDSKVEGNQEETEGKQMEGVESGYLIQGKNGKIIQNVETQVRYHHSRPEDKSYGHALKNGQGEFYQMSSIVEGQSFAGFLQAKGWQMEKILLKMEDKGQVRIGYGKNTEYGKAQLILNEVSLLEEKTEPKLGSCLLYLLSPVLFYDQNGMASCDVSDLMEGLSYYLSEKTGREICLEADPMERYLNYAMTGGWQTTWHAPKQTLVLLNKGSVIRIKERDGKPLPVSTESFFFGERTAEGFGEMMLCPVPEKREVDLKQTDEEKKNEAFAEAAFEEKERSSSFLIDQLKKEQEKKNLQVSGRLAGQACMKEASLNALVNKLLLALRRSKDKEEFLEICNEFSEKKKGNKNKAASSIRTFINKMREGEKANRYCYLEEEEAFVIYIKAFLLEAKYKGRTLEKEESYDQSDETNLL